MIKSGTKSAAARGKVAFSPSPQKWMSFAWLALRSSTVCSESPEQGQVRGGENRVFILILNAIPTHSYQAGKRHPLVAVFHAVGGMRIADGQVLLRLKSDMTAASHNFGMEPEKLKNQAIGHPIPHTQSSKFCPVLPQGQIWRCDGSRPAAPSNTSTAICVFSRLPSELGSTQTEGSQTMQAVWSWNGGHFSRSCQGVARPHKLGKFARACNGPSSHALPNRGCGRCVWNFRGPKVRDLPSLHWLSCQIRGGEGCTVQHAQAHVRFHFGLPQHTTRVCEADAEWENSHAAQRENLLSMTQRGSSDQCGPQRTRKTASGLDHRTWTTKKSSIML